MRPANLWAPPGRSHALSKHSFKPARSAPVRHSAQKPGPVPTAEQWPPNLLEETVPETDN